ncbi:MAG: AAA family ATPase, partial [Gammaproteobacteria bacterium]|nr:AAA family ATPase [Gammaproteobacteria bacterium]
MKPRQFFPLGKAYGNAFCNRTEENKRLIGNIENCKHTFLIAPRRYGKSSLCEKAFESISISHSQLDFHLALSQKDVETIIINGIVSLIGTAIGPAEKLTSIIKRYTKKLQPKFSIGTTGFKLELDLTLDSLPSETIAEALLLLDHLLKEKQKQAVLLLDEFQEIGNIE